MYLEGTYTCIWTVEPYFSNTSKVVRKNEKNIFFLTLTHTFWILGWRMVTIITKVFQNYQWFFVHIRVMYICYLLLVFVHKNVILTIFL